MKIILKYISANFYVWWKRIIKYLLLTYTNQPVNELNYI